MWSETGNSRLYKAFFPSRSNLIEISFNVVKGAVLRCSLVVVASLALYYILIIFPFFRSQKYICWTVKNVHSYMCYIPMNHPCVGKPGIRMEYIVLSLLIFNILHYIPLFQQNAKIMWNDFWVTIFLFLLSILNISYTPH